MGSSEMILCITPNPALDRTILLSSLVVGRVHRAQSILVAAGGKGLNVARTIHRLGGEPLCMGFVGGHTGHLLDDLTQAEGLNSDWTWTDAETRISTILVTHKNDATVINEPGTPASDSDWERLKEDVHKQISSARLVCLSGSLPPGSTQDQLHGLLNMLTDAGKQVWVDTSGEALQTVLAHPGIHIKVNGNEIGDALGLQVNGVESARRVLALLVERMQSTCMITLGPLGAFLATRDGGWQAQGPEVQVVSTVGSGDAFLGGLAHALDGGMDFPEAMCEAVAAGTANALSAGGGQFTLEEFEKIRRQVQLQAW
jgi:1-phosphofructokinase family hexose kinase